MKKLLLLVVMVVMAFIAMAQNPKVSYQAVVRDAQNRLVANTSVSVKVEVLNAENTAVYTETQTVTTNANGLMSMLIGGTDAFAAIDWSNAQIKTTVTIDGADVVNTVPVTAVPYALNANYATELDPESASLAEVYAKILTDSTALAEQINNTADAIDARIKADSLEVVALYEQAQNTLAAMAAKESADSALLGGRIDAIENAGYITKDVDDLTNYTTTEDMNDLLEELAIKDSTALADTAAALRAAMPEAQVQSDWLEDDVDSKAYIANKPGVSVINFWLGEPQSTLDDFDDEPVNNLLGTFDIYNPDPELDDNEINVIIPEADTRITTAKINEFIDNVTMDTAMAVFPHVQGMDNDVKAGLKTWVAQVAKNNPSYVMDIAKYYVTYATTAVVDELVAADNDNALGYAFDKVAANSDTIAALRRDINAIPAQVNADWNAEEGAAEILNKPTLNNKKLVFNQYYNDEPEQIGEYYTIIPNADNQEEVEEVEVVIPVVNPYTLRFVQGENELGEYNASFVPVDMNDEIITIEIPEADTKITTAKINEFIDNVTMDTAMAVFPHVQGMNNDVKAGLKAWVAQVAKNNPTYAMDILTYYIENLTQAQVAEIFGAYGDMNSDAKTDLLNGLAQIIKDNPDIAYDVLNDYIDNVDVDRALTVLPHINGMDNDVKTGLKMWVAQVAKNNPTYVMDVLTYYIKNLTSAQVSEIFGAYDDMNAQAKSDFRDNMLQILDIPEPEAANNATLTIKQGENTLGTFTADASEDVEIEIPEADTKITTAKINEFIDNVTMDTAMAVFPHVQGMDNDVKTGLKMWVAQVAKNNPTYAMDVLTYYIENLTQAQVEQIFGAYSDMNSDAKADLLAGLAQIIKDNPDIAYDVLNYYIDNVDVDRALSVLPHINSMDNDVKTGLKMWITQKVINNPSYILQVLKAYLETPNATTKEEVVTQYAIAHRDVAKAIMVDYLSNGTAQEMTDLLTAFMSNQDAFPVFRQMLDAYIAARIPAAATETSQKFTATAGQTSFTLTAAPKSNYLVRLYINGIMVGDNNTGVISVNNGTTVTYNPAQNGGEYLEEGDIIIISYFK